MADTPTGKQTTPTPPDDMFMQKRLLLAFILMCVVMFLLPMFSKYLGFQQPPPAKPPVEQQAQKPAAPVQPAAPAQAIQAVPRASAAVTVAAPKEDTQIIDTALYRIVFSNRGAVVRSWVLKKFKDGKGFPLDLVHPAGAPKAGYPLALVFKDQKPSLDINQALFVAKVDGLNVDFEFSNAGVSATKSFRFRKDSYLVDVSWSVTEKDAALPSLLAWRGGFGDATVLSAADGCTNVYYDLPNSKLLGHVAKEAKEKPVTSWGVYSFAGIQDRYFAAVALPPHDSQTAIRTYSDQVKGPTDTEEQPYVGVAVGGHGVNRLEFFVGPKDVELLKKVNPKLEQLVDFGTWFGWIAKPLFYAVTWIHNNFTHNYGWAIVVITILINFALLPFRLKSMKSMKKMQALGPQIAAINAKYKNVGLRDPRKAEQNAEVMDLYKKHGVNPMGGCLPMVFQMPPMIAFYTVLTVAIEMRGAEWLWVRDLSQPEHLAIRALPVLMTIAQFIMQKMTPTPGQDPAQAKMMLFMPLIFAFMFYNMSSGLVLYWLTSNVVGIVQQWFINRTMPVAVPAAAPPAKGKKGGK